MLHPRLDAHNKATPTLTSKLETQGRRLEYATIAWNSLEGLLAVATGIAAGSIALVGFGLDSFIEVFAAGVVLWRMLGASEEREQRALKYIGASFFALAIYVSIESLHDLLTRARPDTSTLGIVVMVVSLIVMPILAKAKRTTGKRLGNAALVADSAQTRLCVYLSVSVLIGLTAHVLLGWWWADPLTAFVIAGLAVREGREAWAGKECC